MAVGGEAEQRPDGGQPGVTSPNADRPVGFEVVQERPDRRRIEIVDVQLVRCLAGAPLREAQQQADRVAVGGDGVRAGVAVPMLSGLVVHVGVCGVSRGRFR